MRSSPFETNSVPQIATAVAGDQTQVERFTSFTLDDPRRGKIDVLMKVFYARLKRLAASRTAARLHQLLGECKNDVLATDLQAETIPQIRAARLECMVL
jgi:hypothetical protein